VCAWIIHTAVLNRTVTPTLALKHFSEAYNRLKRDFLTVCPSFCIPLCLSVCLAESLSVSLSANLCVALNVCLSGCNPLWLTVCLSLCISLCLSVWLYPSLTGCLPISLFPYLSVCLAVSLSDWLSAYLSVSLSVCLSGCIPLCLQRDLFRSGRTQHNHYSPPLFILPRITFREPKIRNSHFLCSNGLFSQKCSSLFVYKSPGWKSI